MYRGHIEVDIAGQEYRWPCNFIETPPELLATADPLLPVSVLGRAGFLDAFALTIDSGVLILTRLGPLRRWVRRWLPQRCVWGGRFHPHTVPL